MFEVGDTVRSKHNSLYTGTYTITKVNKTTVWVTEDEGHETMRGGKKIIEHWEYKNVPYHVLVKVKKDV